MKYLKYLFIVIILGAILFLFCNRVDDDKDSNDPEVTVNADGFKEFTKKDIKLQWKISGTNVDIKVSAPTTGWVAVGFDPSSAMLGANIIIGYVDSSNDAQIRDDYGSGMFSHSADDDDDISNKAGTESNGTTQITFTIPLNSGDSQDKILVEGTEYKIILAYGTGDNFTAQHSVRTSVNVTF